MRGNRIPVNRLYSDAGLSPRVRGNPFDRNNAPDQHGSIPARAGEPTAAIPSPVHIYGLSPRVRGNRIAQRVTCTVVVGLSPRVRGNRGSASVSSSTCVGLSPRVRGNHEDGAHVGMIRQTRSIPARAGEPPERTGALSLAWVYPRACGGTPRVYSVCRILERSIPARAGEPGSDGPGVKATVYPRACGGTLPSVCLLVLDGSIPARAGEPKWAT